MHMQASSDDSAKAKTVGYIPSNAAVQFCVITERNMVMKNKYFLLCLIAAFGMEYPTANKHV
jgi:hypothetical protein